MVSFFANVGYLNFASSSMLRRGSEKFSTAHVTM